MLKSYPRLLSCKIAGISARDSATWSIDCRLQLATCVRVIFLAGNVSPRVGSIFPGAKKV